MIIIECDFNDRDARGNLHLSKHKIIFRDGDEEVDGILSFNGREEIIGIVDWSTQRNTLQEDWPDGMCPNCVTPWKCNGPHIDFEDTHRRSPG